jgi:hypothetical protein
MSLTTWLIYLAAGKLITWMLQNNGLLRPLWKRNKQLTELGQCDLCMGFWVFLLLSLRLHRPLNGLLWPLERLCWAMITTFTAHILRIGWETKFGVTVIE